MSPGAAHSGRSVGHPVPRALDRAIRDVVDVYPAGLMATVAQASSAPGIGPLALTYMPARFAGMFLRNQTQQLKVRDVLGFTWGTATYVVPLAYPTSSAIYGRIGVVTRFDPTRWRIFDATADSNNDLYLDWARRQPLFRRAMLTAQAPFYHQTLRDFFRIRYGIDCVLFRPDQVNVAYTRPDRDVWMAVTDWLPGGFIDGGYSARFTDPKVCVIVDDEFEDEAGGTIRRAQLGLTTTYVGTSGLAAQIAKAYGSEATIVRIKA